MLETINPKTIGITTSKLLVNIFYSHELENFEV